ncbi:hypothetical protein, partial [Salmonella sp. SAL4358]|uniref:hypothetical protein n=1 Tax=Salmonella sp. SAL4358 TaxID=3159879 RepID=UPI003978431F
PEMPGIDEIDYLTNSSMMHVDFLPKHLVIIGGSYVGPTHPACSTASSGRRGAGLKMRLTN